MDLNLFTQDLGALVSREPRERPSSMHPDVVLALQGQDVNRNTVSRQGGLRANPRALPTRLVVDVREFMSSLPAVLYQQGLNLVPLTLEVLPILIQRLTKWFRLLFTTVTGHAGEKGRGARAPSKGCVKCP